MDYENHPVYRRGIVIAKKHGITISDLINRAMPLFILFPKMPAERIKLSEKPA